eukprot:scaffold24021_cov37-Tisochrysis_lutea.AAC.2
MSPTRAKRPPAGATPALLLSATRCSSTESAACPSTAKRPPPPLWCSSRWSPEGHVRRNRLTKPRPQPAISAA